MFILFLIYSFGGRFPDFLLSGRVPSHKAGGVSVAPGYLPVGLSMLRLLRLPSAPSACLAHGKSRTNGNNQKKAPLGAEYL